MSYQNGSNYGTDYAKTSVGVAIIYTKRKLFADLEEVLEASHSEQSVLALLECLRILGNAFPKALVVHFGNKDFEKARDGFNEWYEKCEKKIPAKYRKDLRAAADEEFARWEELLSKRPRPSTGAK